jgi:hypothetical protein
MARFAGRPWMAGAFATFVIAALTLFIFPPLWFLLIAVGLALVVLDMTRAAPLPPLPPDDDTPSD